MAQVLKTANSNKFVLCKTGFLTCRKQSYLQQRWLSDNLLVEIINDMMDISITKAELNKAITTYYRNKCDILLLHITNCDDVYKSCSERRINGRRERLTSYYFTTKNELPPPATTNIYNTKESLRKSIVPVITRSTSITKNILTDELTRQSNVSLSREPKRIKLECPAVVVKQELNCENDVVTKQSETIAEETFWNSPEAHAWFGTGNSKNEIVEDTMFKRIKILK